MDPYAAALGVQDAPPAPPPRARTSSGPASAILSPQDQAHNDAYERQPAVARELARAIATANPAQRAILTDPQQNGMAAVAAPSAPAAPDPYAAALGLGGASAAPSAPVQAAAAPAAPDVPPTPSAFGNMGDTANFIARAGANTGNAIYGGLKGLGVLATGGGADAAADAARSAPIPVPTATLGTHQLETVLGSNWNPINWAPKLGEMGGGALADAGMPGAGAALTTAGAAVPLVLGMKGMGKAAPAVGSLEEAVAAAKAAKAGALDTAPRVDPTLVEAPYNPATIDVGGVGRGAPAPAAFVPPTLADASPALQAEVAQAKASGKPISPRALAAHIEADTLPVPGRLTAGQALGDPAMISDEMNGRAGESPTVSPDFYKAQGETVAANLDAIRAKAAPDVAATADMADHGQTIIDAYKQKAADAQQAVSADYQALADAKPGGAFLQGTDVKNAVAGALDTDEAHRSPFLPPALQSAVANLPDNMSLARFESLRTQLATAARSTAAQQDGNVMAAINAARSAVESLPMSAENGAVKALADKARASARTQFQAVAADPAYTAAVNDSVPLGTPSPLADRFVNNYVIRTAAPRADVATMAGNLADNPQAVQAMKAATIDHLTAQMKADATTGNFSQANYNKALEGLGKKVPVLVDPETAQNLQAVGNFAKAAQVQPRGSYVNNSNTFVAGLGSKAASTLEKAGNAALPFFSLGTEARNALAARAAKKASAEAVKPGAGLTSLSDVGKQ